MEIKGEENIRASVQTVWDGLNSTDVLLKSIPGCEEIQRTADNELQAKVMIKLGPVKARFSGKVTMTNVQPLKGYTLNFEGSGGAAGFAKGSADVSLQEADGGTLLTYVANASVGGKLGQIGSRLIEGSAKKLSSEFFAAFAETVAPGHRDRAEQTSADAPPSSDGPAASPKARSEQGSSRMWVAIAAAVVVVIVAASIFSK
ncbi:MAG: carbon monoxide dehydrogenase subunit G [Burkholderiaceae bacterium]|nr:carbon monoxide dehydrogenase subunit G [Burkholderiaceae bacterium]